MRKVFVVLLLAGVPFMMERCDLQSTDAGGPDICYECDPPEPNPPLIIVEPCDAEYAHCDGYVISIPR